MRTASSSRVAVALALALAPFGAAGCALFLSLDGTTGGEGADAAAEVNAFDVSVAEAVAPNDGGGHVDGPATDSSAAGQAGDAGADAAYPPGSWCAMQPAGMSFCDDFDEETTGFERWAAVNLDVGMALLSTNHVSPPYSFDLVVPTYTSGTYFVEDLEETLAPRPGSTQLSFTFDFLPLAMPDAGPGAGDIFVAAIAQGQKQAPRSAFSFRVGPSGAAMQEQVTDASGKDTFHDSPVAGWMPTPGAWITFALSIDYTTMTATVTENASPILSLTLQGPDWSAQAPVSLFLGNWYMTSTPGYEVLYDDAVVRQP